MLLGRACFRSFKGVHFEVTVTAGAAVGNEHVLIKCAVSQGFVHFLIKCTQPLQTGSLVALLKVSEANHEGGVNIYIYIYICI